MLKQRNEQISAAVRLLDTGICIFAFAVAYLIRSSALFAGSPPIGAWESMTWMIATSIVIHLIIYPYLGFYESLRLKSLSRIAADIARAAFVEFFLLGTLVFIIQAKSTSRYFFGLFIAVNYAIILFERLGARIFLASLRQRGYNFRQILVVGSGRNAMEVLSRFRRYKHWGFRVCGLLLEPGSRSKKPSDDFMARFGDVEVLGTLAELEKIIKKRTVDEVYFALDRVDPDEITEQITLCETLGIPARIPFGFFDLPHSKIEFGQMDNLPVFTFYTVLRTPLDALLKRAMDILISIVGLFVTVLLFPLLALLIRLDGKGPVIFKQYRIGQNGRRFKCYKFRTMAVDAESRKKDLASSNKMDGPIFKLDNDPRVTKTGAFLRRTSLDELPQFFNILRGDMSVVGTRPPTPDEVQEYRTHFRRRLSIRPGLTGLWQVSGRSEITRFEDILALDLKYIDNWSLWLDVQIIVRTAWVIFFGRGAH